MKLFGFSGPQKKVPAPLPPLLIAAAWLEIVGGGLGAIGLLTRPLALVLPGMMAVPGGGIWSMDALVRKRP